MLPNNVPKLGTRVKLSKEGLKSHLKKQIQYCNKQLPSKHYTRQPSQGNF